MTESIVRVSMQDDNDLNCSYAIILKGDIRIIITFRDAECAIFDYNSFSIEDFHYKYLLLKHYKDSSCAYKDFLRLIGKMCKKDENSKYFLNHNEEDNRMVSGESGTGHMITESEKVIYEERFIVFKEFVISNVKRF